MWLPGRLDPVPAGVLANRDRGALLWFAYGERYLARPDAISLYAPELPLRPGWFTPGPLGMPGCLRDGAPDAWGERVILNKVTGARGRDADPGDLPQVTYLLESGSDRIGALDFQTSPDSYVPRLDDTGLDELHGAADIVERGDLLPPRLAEALQRGTSIGGARPKVLLADGPRRWIAKFGSSRDTYPVVGTEAASIFLARAVGIPVPDARVVTSLGRDVLLTERFDRPAGGGRRLIISALTMLGLSEMGARHGTYPQILDVLRQYAAHPNGIGPGLFTRVAFNIAISNTDDHLRNHAAFWDGRHLDLTPAYDLSPGPRTGETAFQAIAYGPRGQRASRFADLLAVAGVYDLTAGEARGIVDCIVTTIHDKWDEAADFARLGTADRAAAWRRQFLNPGALYDLPAG